MKRTHELDESGRGGMIKSVSTFGFGTPVWAIFSRNLNFDLNGFPIFRCFKRKSKF